MRMRGQSGTRILSSMVMIQSSAMDSRTLKTDKPINPSPTNVKPTTQTALSATTLTTPTTTVAPDTPCAERNNCFQCLMSSQVFTHMFISIVAKFYKLVHFTLKSVHFVTMSVNRRRHVSLMLLLVH